MRRCEGTTFDLRNEKIFTKKTGTPGSIAERTEEIAGGEGEEAKAAMLAKWKKKLQEE